MHYRIVKPGNPRAAQVLNNIQEWLASDREMQRDRSRLVQMCCFKIPAHLIDAPKPALVIAEVSG